MDFTGKVLSYILEQQLCCSQARLIVGVSGGADSVALLHLLHHNGFRCIVAHCNFHLRGNDSDDDEIFVRKLAAKWDLPFFSISFNTRNVADQQGISIEMAARNLRYEWFNTLLADQQADAIAVAHHADDSIETFFINLMRGTGLRGMLGIRPVQGNIIRPFLATNRNDIINYLNKNHLSFRTDYTNFDESIIRNKIRHTIIPAFESLNPSFREVMEGNFARFAGVQAIANDCVEKLRKKAVAENGNHISIDICQLEEQGSTAFFLYELLRPYHFNAATVNDIICQMDGESGRQFFSPTHRLLKDRKQLLILPLEETDKQVYQIPEGIQTIDTPLAISFSGAIMSDTAAIERNSEVAFLDYDKLKFPLEIRHPHPGDYFYPFGRNDKKKLSDFFIDNKWNLFQKEECWLLLSDNQIVWVIGHRIDNRFRVAFESQKMLIARILPAIV